MDHAAGFASDLAAGDHQQEPLRRGEGGQRHPATSRTVPAAPPPLHLDDIRDAAPDVGLAFARPLVGEFRHRRRRRDRIDRADLVHPIGHVGGGLVAVDGCHVHSSPIDFLHLSDAPARAASQGAAPGLLVCAPVFIAGPAGPSPSADELGSGIMLIEWHGHCSKQIAPGPQVVDVLVAFARPELGDRVSGHAPKQPSHSKQLPQAALRSVHCFLFIQPMHHLFESGASPL